MDLLPAGWLRRIALGLIAAVGAAAAYLLVMLLAPATAHPDPNAVPATGSRLLAAAAAAAAVLLTALAMAALSPSKPLPETASPPDDRPRWPENRQSLAEDGRRLGEQRSALIRDLAGLLPQMPEALQWQAINTLEAVGVRVVRPDGQRFDPARHHAVGTEQAPARDAAGIVARTVRPGYADGEHLVVYPRVVVFENDVPAVGGIS